MIYLVHYKIKVWLYEGLKRIDLKSTSVPNIHYCYNCLKACKLQHYQTRKYRSFRKLQNLIVNPLYIYETQTQIQYQKNANFKDF